MGEKEPPRIVRRVTEREARWVAQKALGSSLNLDRAEQSARPAPPLPPSEPDPEPEVVQLDQPLNPQNHRPLSHAERDRLAIRRQALKSQLALLAIQQQKVEAEIHQINHIFSEQQLLLKAAKKEKSEKRKTQKSS